MTCWYCKRPGHKVRNCFQFRLKEKRIIENQWENIFRIYCNFEGKLYRRKILQFNKEAPNIQHALNEFNKKWMGIDLSETIRKNKLKIMRTYDRLDPDKFEVNFV